MTKLLKPVIKVEKPETLKISLSSKALLDDPWEKLEDKYKESETYQGRQNLSNSNIIELEPGVDGLIHLSEMSWTKKINKAEDALNLGDEVIARIISIKKDKRQISLTLKSIESDPWYRLKGKVPSIQSMKVLLSV